MARIPFSIAWFKVITAKRGNQRPLAISPGR